MHDTVERTEKHRRSISQIIHQFHHLLNERRFTHAALQKWDIVYYLSMVFSTMRTINKFMPRVGIPAFLGCIFLFFLFALSTLEPLSTHHVRPWTHSRTAQRCKQRLEALPLRSLATGTGLRQLRMRQMQPARQCICQMTTE